MASCGVRHFALEYYHSPRGPHSAYTRPCIPAFQQSSNPAYGGVLCAPALPREQQTLAHQQICLLCMSLYDAGTGHLSRGGYQRKQSLPKELINSKW
eukprot:736783-Pelagomonas_calceolata.AAC.1